MGGRAEESVHLLARVTLNSDRPWIRRAEGRYCRLDGIDLDEFYDQARTGDVVIFDQTGVEFFWKCCLRTRRTTHTDVVPIHKPRAQHRH